MLLARDVADVGHPDFTIEDLHADWATPGLDLERDAWVVEEPGGRIVASSLVLGDDARIYVHPDACGRGIGGALRELAEERALERGTAVVRQFIPTGNEAAAPLLLDAGYWPVQHYLRMRIELEDLPAVPGRRGASFERDQDEIAVHELVQAGLSEVEGYIAEPLEVGGATDREEALGPGPVAAARGRRGPGGRGARRALGRRRSATSRSWRSPRAPAGAATGARCCSGCSRRSAPRACAGRSCPSTATTAGPRASTSRSA